MLSDWNGSPVTGEWSWVSMDLNICLKSIGSCGRSEDGEKKGEAKQADEKQRKEVKRETRCFGQMRGTVGGEEKI